MDQGVRFQVLGPLRAVRDGVPVELGTARQRAVLATLLLRANQPVPAEAIVDAVWAEQPPANGPNVVSKYFGRLRRSLGDVLARTNVGYVVRAGRESLDLEAFEHHLKAARSGDAHAELTAALRLWQGVPLSGLTGQLFDAARGRLRELWASAVEDRVELDLAEGRHRELIAELTGLLADDPLRERLAGLLMTSLHRAGRTADALAVFRDLRTRLADELGVDPGPEVCAAHERILRNDAEKPAPPKPSQLRHDLPDFTGRRPELAELTALVAAAGGTLVIGAVDGSAGIGKTALAVHMAHQVLDRYPDGQLYVDLRGFSPGQRPLDPSDVLRRFVQALGMDAAGIPPGLDEQAALYRSLMSDRRMLILLDNAASARQVRPLLPGTSDCLVLVTSRRDLTGLSVRDGARRVQLGLFSTDEALELLSRIIGAQRVAAHPEAARELAALCGHLPLALRIAAQRAVANPSLKLPDLVADLAAHHNRLDVFDGDEDTAVRAVFSWSYQALDAESADAFRAVGLHATPEFGIPAAAALIGTDRDNARRLLNALAAVHLVQHNERGRYQLHDLLHLYAAEQPQPDRADRLRRTLRWYLHTADSAGRTLARHRDRADIGEPSADHPPLPFQSVEEAVAWCETERANLVAIHRQAAAIGEHAVGWQLAVTLWDFYYFRSHWDDWLTTHEVGLSCAREDGDATGLAGVHTSLAHAYLELRRFPESGEQAELGLAIWRRLGHRWGEGIALHILGGVHNGLGRFDDAVDHYRRALALHDEIDNVWGTAWSSASLAVVLQQLGDHELAAGISRQVIAMWQKLGDPYGEGFAVNDLGSSLLALGRVDDALDTYRRSAELNRRIGNRWCEAVALRGVGTALAATGQDEASRKHWSRALVIFTELGDPQAAEVEKLVGGG
jgi:DNA-binding SARP family transcriptional activator